MIGISRNEGASHPDGPAVCWFDNSGLAKDRASECGVTASFEQGLFNSMEPLTDPIARARSSGSGQVPEGGFSALVPELGVRDLDASLRFWCGLLGFAVAYDRPLARFAYLVKGGAQVMLCQHNGRWRTGELEPPLGRGMNFQITVDRLDPILSTLDAAGWPLFEASSEAWYRIGPVEGGQKECLVQDPDGYLVRLAENLGQRSPSTG